ncbi:MAG: hypothetical protein IPG84_15385 [Betaproteobacteria bacterium]|nr:hypothetical protein [Betaproteobacteria bacterium]
MTDMFAAFCAVVSSMPALLVRFGSDTADVVLAEFVHTPGVGRITWIATVACARNARLPSVQLTTPAACEQLPCVGMTPT